MPTSSAGNSGPCSTGHRFLWPVEPAGSLGITLIELMVVLAIIGLIVGVTVPAATNGLSSIHLKGKLRATSPPSSPARSTAPNAMSR